MEKSLAIILEDIGYKLFLERQKRKETLYSVATSIGVTHPIISQIENGRYKSLNIKILHKLTKYYNIQFIDLFLR